MDPQAARRPSREGAADGNHRLDVASSPTRGRVSSKLHNRPLSGRSSMNEPVNRRDFIARASLLPLGAAGVGLGAACFPAVAQTPIKRVGGPKLKTSLNAYSY